MTPKEHILLIREKLTGENTSINDAGKLVVDNLIQKLTRTISELATNIYKKDSHFIMELIQNADDNNYMKGVIPTLKIQQLDDKIIFKNNEVGFHPSNIDSICDIGASTKGSINGGKGYIGEKGIGFKSVFRISDRPEIYSNGYQFRFNRLTSIGNKKRDANLGFILPEWIENLKEDVEENFTNIILPYRQSLSKDEKKRLADIEPDIILFLNKLQRLEINNKQLGTHTTVSKVQKGNVVTINQEEKLEGWKQEVTQRSFYIVENEIKVPAAVNIPQRKGVSTTKIILAFPLDKKKGLLFEEEQKVYSFLPINFSGFRFLIQADFILTSGRESIDEDNPWNLFIRKEIANTFKIAIEEFKNHPKYKYTFINFIPFSREIFPEFFKPLAEAIIQNSRTAKIVLSEADKWVTPDDVMYAADEERNLFDGKLLMSATYRVYINRQYPFSKDVFETLDIDSFEDADLRLCLDNVTNISKKDMQWFFDLFLYLSKKFNPTITAHSIKKCKIVPLQNARSRSLSLTDLHSEHVFFPLEKDIDYAFESSINILSKELYTKVEDIKNKTDKRKVIDFLQDLGIRNATPYTITKNFILKKYESEAWKSVKSDELEDHLVYIKDHWGQLKNHHAEILNVLQGKNIIRCKSIGDGKNYFTTPAGVYISNSYGNKNLLEKMFLGIDHVYFIHDCYLTGKEGRSIATKTEERTVKEWYNFFKTLGCKEIPLLLDPATEVEINKLISEGNPGRINQFLTIIDQHWSFYKKSFNVQKVQKSGWFKKLTEERFIPVRETLYHAKNIFLNNSRNKTFFGDTVTYFPKNISVEFANVLGMNDTVNGESVLKFLSELSSKKSKLSKERATQLYKYLANDDTVDLSEFATEKLIYLHTSGRWYDNTEVFWNDCQNIFGHEFGYCEKNYPASLKDFFVDRVEINEKPGIDHFIDFLVEIDERSEEENFSAIEKETIYKVYSQLGTLALKKDVDRNALSRLNGYIWTTKETFWRNDDDIYYNDNDELFELFKLEESIAFFDVPRNVLPQTKALLTILNIPAISEVVNKNLLNADSATLDLKLSNRIRKYAEPITSIIYSEHTAFYELNKESALFGHLTNIEIYESPELEVEYVLHEIKKVSLSSSIHFNNQIYVSRDNPDRTSAVAFEISKLLGIPKLFEFILLLITLPKSTISFILKQKGIVVPPEEIIQPTADIRVEGIIDIYEEESGGGDMPSNDHETPGHFDEPNEELELLDTVLLEKAKAVSAKWIPEIIAEDISVKIERYAGGEIVIEDEDMEGRVLLKNSFQNGNSNRSEVSTLSKEDKDGIGDYGEKVFYLELTRQLYDKYAHCKFVKDATNQILQISENGKIIVELKWLNSKKTIQEGYDLVVTEHGIKKYYEVKTTRGTEGVVFAVSPQQWRFIKLKGENYSIIRVLNAGTNNIKLIEINNPFHLWIEGRLNVYPINIEL